MSSRMTQGQGQGQGQLLVPNENLHINHKKPAADVNAKSSKTTTKKGSAAVGSRKALTDITNKAPVIPNASSKKNVSKKEEFNIAEEMILHDHKKCIEARQIELNSFQLDLVLPGIDSLGTDGNMGSQKEKDDLDSLHCYPEPEELSMSEFSDWLESTNRWESPPRSPPHRDSPSFSVFPWRIEDFEFAVRQDDDA